MHRAAAILLSISLLNACAARVGRAQQSIDATGERGAACSSEDCIDGGNGSPLAASVGIAAVIGLIGAGTWIYRLVRDPQPPRRRAYTH